MPTVQTPVPVSSVTNTALQAVQQSTELHDNIDKMFETSLFNIDILQVGTVPVCDREKLTDIQECLND